MAFWLAQAREGQCSDHIQRFDPRFWTVDFPRPMMASVVATAPDELRVDAEFHHADALAGLIWESADRFDHPLLAYDTDRDYSRSTLRFRWRSSGVLPLDAVNGPTLTIEGRDAQGNARSWYVRLWNYATGTVEDAEIVLPFSALDGGFLLPAEADRVYPSDIDRMFISLVPAGYDPGDPALLPARGDAWIELTGIACDGERAVLAIGDVLVPPHGIGMATAFDDAYNQTPQRLLRNITGLGYRGAIIHYVGMSHYFRLDHDGGEPLLVETDGSLCAPCEAWHGAFFAECAETGFEPIMSLSFELFAAHCPTAWAQRGHDGTQALTGWVPPSTLLSPANADAVGYLTQVAISFVALAQQAGLPVHFQIGEPWWWITPDGAPCIFDDAMAALYDSGAPAITDLKQPLATDQLAMLDLAGDRLGAATATLRDAVRAADPAAEICLLLFTPTVLDPAMPDLPRLNLPDGWAWPAYDRLQIEDYDWLTAGAEAERARGYAAMQARLAYPLEGQDYLSGFVLLAGDADAHWPLIDDALDEAAGRGVARRFVWALPQVCRDGYTRLPATQDDAMQAFDEVYYPIALGRDAGVSPEFSTTITTMASGHERRVTHWSDARLRYDVGPGIRSEDELATLIAFFRARRGAARGFLLGDPFDFSSNGMTGTPTPVDQPIGTGDGLTAGFAIRKSYGGGIEPQVRPITRPRTGTVRVSVDGGEVSGWTLESGGRIVFAEAPAPGTLVRAGFLFDVPVRFAEDRLDVNGSAFAAGEAPSVPLIELREDV